jgi:hypothetical protein
MYCISLSAHALFCIAVSSPLSKQVGESFLSLVLLPGQWRNRPLYMYSCSDSGTGMLAIMVLASTLKIIYFCHTFGVISFYAPVVEV